MYKVNNRTVNILIEKKQEITNILIDNSSKNRHKNLKHVSNLIEETQRNRDILMDI